MTPSSTTSMPLKLVVLMLVLPTTDARYLRQLTSCSFDVQSCPGGTFVKRDPDIGCRFEMCPPLPGLGPVDRKCNPFCDNGRDEPCMHKCAQCVHLHDELYILFLVPQIGFVCPFDQCNYQCPSSSFRKTNRQCYNNFDDCQCFSGHYKRNGRCEKQHTNKCNYQCPSSSFRKPNRQCYNNFDDCQCFSSYNKRNGRCEKQQKPHYGQECYRQSTGRTVRDGTVVDCVKPIGKKCKCDNGQWFAFGYTRYAAK